MVCHWRPAVSQFLTAPHWESCIAITVRLTNPPLILIPGAFGSRLRDINTGKEVWPGSDARLLFSNYKGLEVSINENTLDPNADEIEAYRLFGQGLGRNFYRQVVRMLEQAGGYQQRLPGDPIESGQRNFYIYLYDPATGPRTYPHAMAVGIRGWNIHCYILVSMISRQPCYQAWRSNPIASAHSNHMSIIILYEL